MSWSKDIQTTITVSFTYDYLVVDTITFNICQLTPLRYTMSCAYNWLREGLLMVTTTITPVTKQIKSIATHQEFCFCGKYTSEYLLI